MTWKELLALSDAKPAASLHVLRHGVAAAMSSEQADLRAWINATRGLSSYALCSVLDNHGIEVPDAAIAAVRGTDALG